MLRLQNVRLIHLFVNRLCTQHLIKRSFHNGKKTYTQRVHHHLRLKVHAWILTFDHVMQQSKSKCKSISNRIYWFNCFIYIVYYRQELYWHPIRLTIISIVLIFVLVVSFDCCDLASYQDIPIVFFSLFIVIDIDIIIIIIIKQANTYTKGVNHYRDHCCHDFFYDLSMFAFMFHLTLCLMFNSSLTLLPMTLIEHKKHHCSILVANSFFFCIIYKH